MATRTDRVRSPQGFVFRVVKTADEETILLRNACGFLPGMCRADLSDMPGWEYVPRKQWIPPKREAR